MLIAAQVIEHPQVAFDTARRNLERQRRSPTQSRTWTDRRATLVDAADITTIVDVLTDVDDRTGLRQTRPFRGLVSEDQRRAAFDAVAP